MSYNKSRRLTEWLALLALWTAAIVLIIFSVSIFSNLVTGKVVATEDRIAEYTLWLFIATGLMTLATFGLGYFSKVSADASNKAFELSQQEFFSANRPKLIVRNAYVIAPKQGAPIRVQFDITNIGSGPAKKIFYRFEVIFPHEAHNLNFKMQRVNFLDALGRDLASGERIGAEYTDQNDWKILPQDTGTNSVVLKGLITYEDNRGVKRETAVCRAYNGFEQRFIDPQDAGIDYAD